MCMCVEKNGMTEKHKARKILTRYIHKLFQVYIIKNVSTCTLYMYVKKCIYMYIVHVCVTPGGC